MKLKFIDLFCGIGGFHLALKDFADCVYASDKDPHSQKIYEENFNIKPDSDISKIESNNIPEHDIICAGFPCQPFSSAGKRKGFLDPRGSLFYDILRIAIHHKTKVLFLENVSSLVHHDNGRTFKTIIHELTINGYKVSYDILNSKDFNLAQSRKRLIIIASKDKKFDFSKIKKESNNNCIKNILENNLNNLYLNENKYTLIKETKKQKSGLIFCGYLNKKTRKNGIKNFNLNLSRVHRQPNRIYDVEGIHPTISSQETSGRYYIYDGIGVRKLTLLECFRLQGFPDSYKKIGSKTQLYQRVGNSVPVSMISALSKEIINQLF